MKKDKELAEVISLADVRNQRRYSFNHPSFYHKLKKGKIHKWHTTIH